MKLKTFLTMNALVAMIAGLGFALAWLSLVGNFLPGATGIPLADLDTPTLTWLLASFTRMFGVALLGLGALLFAIRDVKEKALRRGVIIALFLAHSFAAWVALAQQIAIWGTFAGWVMVLICGLGAVGYGVYFVQDVLAEWRPRPQPISDEEREYNLELIRYVTQNFSSLQGLRNIPLGLWFLALAAGWLGKQGDCTVSMPALLLAIILWFAMGLYYRRRFGRVNASNIEWKNVKLKANSPVWLLIALPIGWLVFAALGMLSLFDQRFQLPISTPGLMIAIGIALAWCLPPFQRRTHYLVLALLIAGLSFLPMTGVLSQQDANGYPGGPILNIALGLAFVVGGLLDHAILVQAFRPLPEEESHE